MIHLAASGIHLSECLAVIADRHLKLLREEHPSAIALHEVSRNRRNLRLCSKIESDVKTIVLADESLPLLVAIGPSATYTVNKSLVAGSRILGRILLIEYHLTATCLMSCRLERLRTLSLLMLKVERIDASLAQHLNLLQRTLLKLRIILLLRSVPSNLCNGKSARIKHILYVFRSRDIFSPQISLHTCYHVSLCLRQVLTRHIAIHFLKRQIASDGLRLCVRSVLISIKVAVSTRRENHVVAVLDGFMRLLGSSPYHNGGVLGKVAGDYLVPTHQLSAVLVEETSEMSNQIGLQTFLVRAKLLHLALAERTRRP